MSGKWVLGIVMVLVLAASRGAVGQTNLVRATLLADQSAVVPGQPFTVGVLLTLQPGWHVYWLYPGDAGLQTRVTFNLPEGWTAGALRFPVPETFIQPGEVMGYGYEDQVLLTAILTPPKDLPESAPITISATVTWLACREVCIPGRQAVNLVLPVSGLDESAPDRAEPTNQALFSSWAPRYPVPAEQSGVRVRQGVRREAEAVQGWVEMAWTKPPAEVRLLTVPGEMFEVRDVHVEQAGDVTTVRYRVVALAGQTVEDTTLPMVVAYRMERDAPWRGVAVEQALGKQKD